MNRTRPSASGCGTSLLVSRYLDGELTPGRCRVVERHLRACKACAAIARRMRKTIAACREARDTRLPSGVRRRARARIKALLR
jgi:anti-sigma factor RsiW